MRLSERGGRSGGEGSQNSFLMKYLNNTRGKENKLASQQRRCFIGHRPLLTAFCICCGTLCSSTTSHYHPNQSSQNDLQGAFNKIGLCTFPKRGGRGKIVRTSPEVTATTSSRVAQPRGGNSPPAANGLCR